ncbi:glycosyltransferase family 2 protein [Denitrobacterium detoxificans]|jgi:glycosyltransferase involved in cell wall biosynthesis|uniref:glycosyltransferase family 2 protein n=1 Tax=Denitrobacterium detoxificans TaxID=79604 RepID=UPI0026EE2789|nr:glycosyltransferase family 2 protein [Denitrobacterium detoxificans]MBE6466265.1 glycosyltransferase family 2 protein [Denitrobacterium detoxificans]
MKTLLVIPAYNEEENIERVVDALIADYPAYSYLVVNDGSRDATADICRRRGYRFLDLPINVGLSGAFQAGLKYAYRNGYDCVIQFDADGQHLPEYLDSLVAALETNDVVIGSRFVNERKPSGLRGFGGSLISGMIRLTTGTKITDPTSGMRAYNRRMIKELAFGPNLGPEPDTLSYLMRKKGARIAEVPVQMAERTAGTSYFNPWSASMYMFRTALSVLLIQFFR